MNLTHERNEMTGMEKRYTYDDLHRLTRYQVTQASPSQDFAVNYAYDAVGNLLQKSDYANNYHYADSNQFAQNAFPANGVCRVTKLDLVDTTLTRTEENGTLGFASMAGYGEYSEFPDTVYYTRNLTAFRSYISKSSPFILDSVVNSMCMDVCSPKSWVTQGRVINSGSMKRIHIQK